MYSISKIGMGEKQNQQKEKYWFDVCFELILYIKIFSDSGLEVSLLKNNCNIVA